MDATVTHAFEKILEFANDADRAYPLSGHIALIQQVCALMLTAPTMVDLKRITCESP